LARLNSLVICSTLVISDKTYIVSLQLRVTNIKVGSVSIGDYQVNSDHLWAGGVFTRKKHESTFPINSIKYCLEGSNI
jgi:hypothetical protein